MNFGVKLVWFLRWGYLIQHTSTHDKQHMDPTYSIHCMTFSVSLSFDHHFITHVLILRPIITITWTLQMHDHFPKFWYSFHHRCTMHDICYQALTTFSSDMFIFAPPMITGPGPHMLQVSDAWHHCVPSWGQRLLKTDKNYPLICILHHVNLFCKYNRSS